jgi:hypothetical protein
MNIMEKSIELSETVIKTKARYYNLLNSNEPEFTAEVEKARREYREAQEVESQFWESVLPK